LKLAYELEDADRNKLQQDIERGIRTDPINVDGLEIDEFYDTMEDNDEIPNTTNDKIQNATTTNEENEELRVNETEILKLLSQEKKTKKAAATVKKNKLSTAPVTTGPVQVQEEQGTAQLPNLATKTFKTKKVKKNPTMTRDADDKS
jgi:hypothetical protein